MIAVVLGLAALVADETARWPRGDEWYLVGDTWRLARVNKLPPDGKTVEVVGPDGKPQVFKFEPDRYVLLDAEPELLALLLCGQEVPGAISSAAGADPGAGRWSTRFGEVVSPVGAQPGGFDGRPRKVGAETFVLVWKWDRETRKRSAGWVREATIERAPVAPRTERPFEAELAPGRAVPVFYQFGLLPTASLERRDVGAKGVRVPTKAVLKRNRSAAEPEYFRVVCYSAPGGAAIHEPLRVLQHYHVYSATEVDGPSGTERWYLIGAEDFVALRRPQDGPTRTLLGWVRGENVVLWGTAQALEFDPGTRPQRTFPSPDGKRVLGLGEIHSTFEKLAERYVEGKNPRPAAVEIPERFQNHLARMPVLEQRTLTVKGQAYTAYKVAYVAHNLVLPEAARKELSDLRTRLDEVSTLDLLFVVDATANSGVHRAALRASVRAAWERVEQQNRQVEDEAARGMFPFRLRVRVGVLAYREPSDREWELEAFDFTDDKTEFDGWWSDRAQRRLVFSGGFGAEAHVSSVRKALGVAFATAADGKADVAVPGPKARSKTLKFNWAPGSQRVVVVLGDVGQKDTAEERYKTDKLFGAWNGLKHKPFLVGVQVGTPDWFTFPSEEARGAAVRGYERFGEDFRVLAEQINATDPGRRRAAFHHLKRPGDAERQKELAETFDTVWTGTVLARAREARAELSGAWGKKVRAIAAQLGVAPAELTAAVLKPGEPLIRYDEGWVIERNPFPDAPGFNVKQVCPCVLIDDAELRLIQGMLLIVADKLAQARIEAAREAGASAVGELLAKSLAQINKPVREQMSLLAARHPALHFIENFLRYTPEQFKRLEESQIVQWETPINLSVRSIKEYLDDPNKWGPAGARSVSWMPITLLPDEGGQFPLTRVEVERLRDQVLKPLHGAFLEARAAGGKEKVAPRLERWAQSPDGQKVAEVMKAPQLIQARVGVLAMSPAQLGELSEEDVVLWHQAVFRAVRECETILTNEKAWVPYKGAQTTWYPVTLLPNPFRITTRDARDLDTELEKFTRDRKPKEK